ncbi:MAG: YdcH family protein [Novosphingobium sp.]
MSDRVFRLLERHQRLDEALRRLQANRWPDPFEIARLKKLKLAIKDRLARLAQRPARSRA